MPDSFVARYKIDFPRTLLSTRPWVIAELVFCSTIFSQITAIVVSELPILEQRVAPSGNVILKNDLFRGQR